MEYLPIFAAVLLLIVPSIGLHSSIAEAGILTNIHILYEAETDTSTNELVMNSFDSFNDLINYNYQATIVDVHISAGYSSTGLAYDNDSGKYPDSLTHPGTKTGGLSNGRVVYECSVDQVYPVFER
jgi:hypothetical protein